MLRDELTSDVAGIILEYLRSVKGRLTEVSNLSGINRREINRKGLSKMRMNRLMRLVYTMQLVMPPYSLKPCGRRSMTRCANMLTITITSFWTNADERTESSTR